PLHLTEAAAAPFEVVARQQARVPAADGHTEPISLARYRGEVEHDDDVRLAGAPHERHDGVLLVGNIDPGESLPAGIVLPERGLATIEQRELRDEALEGRAAGVG